MQNETKKLKMVVVIVVHFNPDKQTFSVLASFPSYLPLLLSVLLGALGALCGGQSLVGSPKG